MGRQGTIRQKFRQLFTRRGKQGGREVSARERYSHRTEPKKTKLPSGLTQRGYMAVKPLSGYRRKKGPRHSAPTLSFEQRVENYNMQNGVRFGEIHDTTKLTAKQTRRLHQKQRRTLGRA